MFSVGFNGPFPLLPTRSSADSSAWPGGGFCQSVEREEDGKRENVWIFICFILIIFE